MGPFSWNSNQNAPQIPPYSLYLKGGMSTLNFDSFGFDLRKWTKELLAYLNVPTWDESFQGKFNPCSWVSLPQCGTSALDIFNVSGGGVQIRTANNCKWFFSDGCDLYLPGSLIFPDGTTLGTGNGFNGIQITDGTTTINGVKSLFVSGGTLSGTSPSGVLYVTGGGGGTSLSGVGFVKVSGTTISYDNTSYLSSITSSQIVSALGYTPISGITTPLALISGGTGIFSVTNGDLLYASSNTYAKLPIGTSGQTLASNGSFPLWVTPTFMNNPMTTLNDIIYGGASGTPTRLASGVTGTFLQMGVNTQCFDLFVTTNTWTASKNYTAAISGTPFFGLTITNNTQGTSFSTTGAGIKYVHNSISGFTMAVNSSSSSAIDKTIYNESLFGWSWRSNGKNANSSANYYWELEGTNEYMSLVRAASAPHTSLNLFTANGGSGSARLNFATGGGISFIHGTLGRLGFNIGSPNSTVHISGSMSIAFLIKTASYTFTATDYGVIFSGSTAAQTITLPTAASIAGRTYELVNVGSVSVTLGTTSSETFLNVTGTPTSLTLAASAGKSIKVLSTGAAWVQLN